MTKLDDLRALSEAVKAGTATDFRALLTDSNDPAERAKHCGWASGAYRGRLYAAHALHKALLPGWHYVIHEHAVRLDHLDHPEIMQMADTPARAWLLAILAALMAMEGR